jgi:TPR repeat protein
MAAEANDPPALGRMGQAELEGHYRPANQEAALPWLEKAAAAKDPLGLWLLSRCYDTGLAGLTPSVEKAVNFCSQAAMAGQVDAMNRMGEFYATARGLPGDPVAATGWFRLAADYGHGPASAKLAICYLDGTGCRQNEALALEFATKASELNQPRGTYLLGRIHDEGLGVKPNPILGLAYHLRAGKGGIREAGSAVARLKAKMVPEEIQQAEKLAFPEESAGSGPPKPP